MRFGRKRDQGDSPDTAIDAEDTQPAAPAGPATGPFDVSQIDPGDGTHDMCDLMTANTKTRRVPTAAIAAGTETT